MRTCTCSGPSAHLWRRDARNDAPSLARVYARHACHTVILWAAPTTSMRSRNLLKVRNITLKRMPSATVSLAPHRKDMLILATTLRTTLNAQPDCQVRGSRNRTNEQATTEGHG
eukprot:4160601-Amphidinium_carterae.1